MKNYSHRMVLSVPSPAVGRLQDVQLPLEIPMEVKLPSLPNSYCHDLHQTAASHNTTTEGTHSWQFV